MPASIDQLAPDFTLRDLSGQAHTLSERRGRITVVNFWSAECPWSRRGDEIIAARLPGWAAQGVAVWGVASNASEPEYEIQAEIADRGTPYPVLLDPGNVVADLYGAVTTPHLYLVDGQGVLRYSGALDDATFRRRAGQVRYLENAIEAVRAGRAPDPAETPGYGCTIVRVNPGGQP